MRMAEEMLYNAILEIVKEEIELIYKNKMRDYDDIKRLEILTRIYDILKTDLRGDLKNGLFMDEGEPGHK